MWILPQLFFSFKIWEPFWFYKYLSHNLRGLTEQTPKPKAESSLRCNILPIPGNTCQTVKRGAVCTPTMLQLSNETEDKSCVKQADSRPFPNSQPCFTPCSSHKADLHLKRVTSGLPGYQWLGLWVGAASAMFGNHRRKYLWFQRARALKSSEQPPESSPFSRPSFHILLLSFLQMISTPGF